MKDVIVFDLDGTLALVDHRTHKIDRNDPRRGTIYAGSDHTA